MCSLPYHATSCRTSAGRHPLAEILVDSFIPNDTHMGADAGRLHVITGDSKGYPHTI